ncbi:hypothetical protein MPSEU_000634700 [Mayamaea pseudoterrestris]|nr:hypothetical protein MPSEU_000634700 [Mayamaea pseudoterrestris]
MNHQAASERDVASQSTDAAIRMLEMQETIQALQRDKEKSAKLIAALMRTEETKDAQVEQLTTWCRQLSTANQALLQDKANMLHQAKQATEWCQQLLETNQRLQQEHAQSTEQYSRRLTATTSSVTQQRDIYELMRQKSILVEFASGQAKQLEQIGQANAQLLILNQELEHKIRAMENDAP